MSEIAIAVKNVSKCFNRYERPLNRLKEVLLPGRSYAEEFWALRDINLEVPAGKTVGVIGRNGSGKSTLLQIIAGTMTPTSGSVGVSGRIGALLELGSGFNPEFTGRENVFLNGAILGLSREEMAQRFEAIAEFADIGQFIDQPVKTYSSGMMMRLAFAVSVNVEPEILIIDEALAVGDAAFQFKCFERLERLTQSGVSTLFVSHDIGTVKAFCEQVLYLDSGTARAFGPADEIAELYLMQLRDRQKRSLSGSAPVRAKESIGGDKGIAFGTDEGRIIRAEFGDTGSLRSAYNTGDTITVRAEVEFVNILKYPTLCLIVQNRQLLPIGGQFLKLANQTPDKISRCCAVFSFRARLTEGTYFLTFRLEDRQSDSNFFVVDKQVAVLSFEVLKASSRKFLGMVDLGIKGVEEKALKCSNAGGARAVKIADL
jgi:lipopolysaccharide transport system ATP-binding protein